MGTQALAATCNINLILPRQSYPGKLYNRFYIELVKFTATRIARSSYAGDSIVQSPESSVGLLVRTT